MLFLYEVLLYLVFLLGLPIFLVIGLVRGKYITNLGQRLGFYGTPRKSHDLWIHAVSVGEALAARTIIESIERLRPGTSIVLTTTTITGQTQARRLYPRLTVTYFPLDFSFAVRRFLAHHDPRAFATMETEIWPNVTRIARARGLRLALANGRISDRSFPRYRLFRMVVAPVLHRYDRILAREEVDRQRFLTIGAPPAIVETTGNVKFDYQTDATPLADGDAIVRLIGGRPVLVIGSTVAGEDEILIPSIQRLASTGIFVIVAPRKPERFDVVARLADNAGLAVARRSTMRTRGGAADLLLLDTIGELSRIYQFATVAFVGGTLVPVGGHNPIEPAAAGVPVCFGPSMSNFREIAATFLRNEAAAEVRDPAALEEFVLRIVGDAGTAAAWGRRARETVAANRGASERTARRVVELLS